MPSAVSISDRLGTLAARARVPLILAGVAAIVMSAIASLGALGWIGLALVLVGLAAYFRLGTVKAEPIAVHAPVRGRWVAVNSPATKVPSHGLHAWGQTYAVDLLRVPSGSYEPHYGWSGGFRPPAAFPSFGEPVLAPSDGQIVSVHDGEPDHTSRTSWPALIWFTLEGMVREVRGPAGILGNHVILRMTGGPFAAVAHLQRGSITVRPGEQVRRGEPVGRCGNSGSSTEPHVHFQLMDHGRPLIAAGLPFGFDNAQQPDGRPIRVPKEADPFIATDGTSGRDGGTAMERGYVTRL